jgi:hypothetical protein
MQRSIVARRSAKEMAPLNPPTFDEVLDTLRMCSRGKAMGPGVVLIELNLVGGLPQRFLFIA